MYEQHFGFSRSVFTDAIAQDEAVFRTAGAERLGQDLEIALARKDSVAILSGDSGTGKTTLALDALKAIDTRLAFACISHPPLTANELLEQLLSDFGCEPSGKSRAERLLLWRQFLSEMHATDTRVCLLVESAENFEAEVLKSLHSLTASDAALSPGSNVVLTTTRPSDALLDSPELQAFSQRVRLRRRIDPLTASETADYLAFKCRLGNVEANRVLADDAAAALFEFSAGVIRVIDSLLESALMSAASRGQSQVSASLIGSVAVDQFGMSRQTSPEIEALLDLGASEAADPAGDGELSDIPTLTDFVDAPSDPTVPSVPTLHVGGRR